MNERDLQRAFVGLKDQAWAESMRMRKATDPREVREAAKAFAGLNDRIGKLADRLPVEVAGVARAQHAEGLRLLEKAKARAEALEREPQE